MYLFRKIEVQELVTFSPIFPADTKTIFSFNFWFCLVIHVYLYLYQSGIESLVKYLRWSVLGKVLTAFTVKFCHKMLHVRFLTGF